MKRSYLLLFFIPCVLEAKLAMVSVSVADATGQPLFGSYNTYCSIPWSCSGRNFEAAPRVHQLLLHESVEIIKEQNNEILVKIPHIYYKTANNSLKNNTFWMHKSCIIPYDDLRKKVPLSQLPLSSASNYPLVYLIDPWKHQGMLFSIGTSFCVKEHKGTLVTVWYYDVASAAIVTMDIPEKQLVYQDNFKSPDLKMAQFVALLRRWATRNIPYVLGGCSYGGENNLVPAILNAQKTAYVRKSDDESSVKMGFDCSNIILRAAHITGIPFLGKNSYTMFTDVPMVAANQPIQCGDIIWIAGHVMVISSLNPACVVESHSYDGGYGVVHEKPLGVVFKGVDTIEQLEGAYRSGTLLNRLNSSQEVYQRTCCKILSLRSVI